MSQTYRPSRLPYVHEDNLQLLIFVSLETHKQTGWVTRDGLLQKWPTWPCPQKPLINADILSRQIQSPIPEIHLPAQKNKDSFPLCFAGKIKLYPSRLIIRVVMVAVSSYKNHHGPDY